VLAEKCDRKTFVVRSRKRGIEVWKFDTLCPSVPGITLGLCIWRPAIRPFLFLRKHRMADR